MSVVKQISMNLILSINRIKLLLHAFLFFKISNCNSIRHDFAVLSVIKKNKIEIQFDEIVIHFDFQLPTSNKNNSTSSNLKEGIAEKLKDCQIKNKRISVYTGAFQFLNYVSKDKVTLNSNFLKENPKRLDITLKNLDTVKSKNYSSSNKTYIQNFELYFYSISNPLFYYEVLETRKEEPFNLEKNHLKDHFNFGLEFGEYICNTLKEL